MKTAEFNSSDLGDKNSQIICYDFPFDKLPEFDTLVHLKQKNIIKREGSDKTGYWKIKKF